MEITILVKKAIKVCNIDFFPSTRSLSVVEVLTHFQILGAIAAMNNRKPISST